MHLKLHLFSTVFALLLTVTLSRAQSYDITQGSITFTKQSEGLKVEQGENEPIYLFGTGAYSNITVYGNSIATTNIIIVNSPTTDPGYDPIITLSNVVIHSESDIPIKLEYSSVLSLILAPGTSNEVKTTGVWCPGIKVSDEDGTPNLSIRGSGTLVVAGGESSAGIGGYLLGNASIISIEDRATVIATGGMGGAGIGGGLATSGGAITITSNAVVFAHGGNGGENYDKTVTLGGAAGIGGGGWSFESETFSPGGAGGTITLSGNARVTAQAGVHAAGIGGGEDGYGGMISIGLSNKVVAASDGIRPAIDDDDLLLDGDGYVLLANYKNTQTAGKKTEVKQYLRSIWTGVANFTPTNNYQSIAFSLQQATSYRLYCNNVRQEYLSGATFSIYTATGLYNFPEVININSYLITLNMGFGGSGGTPNVDATYNDLMPEAIAPTNSFSYYTFGGYYWVDGVTQYYNADMVPVKVCDHPHTFTLYAKWIDERVGGGTYDWYTNQVSPYTISTSAQLLGLGTLVNGTAPGLARDTFSGKLINLASNINLSAYNWIPIGNYSLSTENIFQGSFNGGHKTISGLTNVASSSTHQGLFGYLGSTATLSNLTVSATITAADYVGAIAGYSAGGSIMGCSASGTIKGTNNVGGIVGASSGIIRGCSSAATVEGADYVGGIAGHLASAGSLQNCIATGSVTGLELDTYVGGIVGSNAGLVQNCSVSAQVTGLGDSAFVGGIAGWNSGPVQNGLMLGTLVFGSSVRVGALVGENINAGSLTRGYFLNTAGVPRALGLLTGTYTSLGRFSSTAGALTATDGTTLLSGAQLHIALNRWVYTNNGTGGLLWWTTATDSYPTLTATRPPFTLSTPSAVPFSWLGQYYPGAEEASYEALAQTTGANNRPIWESYIAGLTPTNTASTFTASITFLNGSPLITWSPNLIDRSYTVQGKATLSAPSWGVTNNTSRFFQVKVDMP
jgi:hypothetical protein